ncbi:helix-turn-helix domain-containing protein [Paenibacillaceae bacterium WGS1546]|uniref:helix-turn-helix domain-containing protein n=1 Tax=Cohnella sp. WGS1546 TaxID=3366810 RepID=UPI00372D62AB
MTQKKSTKAIIGERIRHYRTMKNLTQDELAERTGSTGSYIGRIERGERNFNLSTVEKICDELNISVFTLFAHEDTPDLLRDHPWLQKSIALLLEQSERNQQKAFRILQEMFSD